MEDPDWEKKIDLDDPKACLRLKRKASILADFELIKKRRQETKTLKVQENAQKEIIETQRAMRRVYEAEHLQMESGDLNSLPKTPSSSQSFGLEMPQRSNSSNSCQSLNSAFKNLNNHK